MRIQVDRGTVHPELTTESETWLESGLPVKVEPTALADAVDMGSKRKRLLILQL